MGISTQMRFARPCSSFATRHAQLASHRPKYFLGTSCGRSSLPTGHRSRLGGRRSSSRTIVEPRWRPQRRTSTTRVHTGCLICMSAQKSGSRTMLPSSGHIPARSSVLVPKMAVLDRIKSSSPMAVGCGAIGVTLNRCVFRRRGRRRETMGQRLTRPATVRRIRHRNLVLEHDQPDRQERRHHHLTARDAARAARRFPPDLMISYCPVLN